jgi:hypothetical protein
MFDGMKKAVFNMLPNMVIHYKGAVIEIAGFRE